MTEIPLTRGHVTLIDDADAPFVMQHKWYAHVSPKGDLVYAVRSVWTPERVKRIYLHRELMDPPAGMLVDHINRDSLDNRRCNLRFATTSQNVANGVSRRGRKLKGAYFQARTGKWRANIRVKQKIRHLGCFATEEEAARAYDMAALEFFGAFASLNFPVEELNR